MSISPARTAAYDVLLRVESDRAYASELLHSPQFSALSVPDHALAIELVMGVLRWRSRLDENIRQYCSTKLGKLDVEVLTCLRLGAYQLLFLDRVPRHAAVDESVKLVKRARKGSAVPLANAVLRRLSAGIGQQPAPAISGAIAGESSAELAASSAHPSWLVEGWVQRFGMERARLICSYDQQVPEVCLHAWTGGLGEGPKEEPAGLAPGRLLASARRLRSGYSAGALALRNESYSIQDEASQLVALLVGRGGDILDGCASPGGKTRIIARRNPRSRIIACELHPHRARLLRKLVADENVRVIAADLRALPLTLAFDRVLADVPCSGTGTLARNPEIKWRLRPEDLGDLQARQLAMVQAAMRHTRPGGRLVYATCSLEPEENSEVIEQALSTSPGFHLIDCRAELGKLRSEGEIVLDSLEDLVEGSYLRTIPGVHPCDGFFAAILARD